MNEAVEYKITAHIQTNQPSIYTYVYAVHKHIETDNACIES